MTIPLKIVKPDRHSTMLPFFTRLRALGLVGALGVGSLLYPDEAGPLDVSYIKTDFNTSVLKRCSALFENYRRHPLIKNEHFETVWGVFLRFNPGLLYRREILKCRDGGSIALDHYQDKELPELPKDAPVLILLPGLTGGSGSSYVQHAINRAYDFGIRAIVFNARGTAKSPVTTPKLFAGSSTDDTRTVVEHLHATYPESEIFAMAWSMGANNLLNYLAEEGTNTPLMAAVSLCNPFNLSICDKATRSGFAHNYTVSVGGDMREIFLRNGGVFQGLRGYDIEKVKKCQTVQDFDELVMTVMYDFPDLESYYEASGCYNRVHDVQIPLLCIQALDDPIAVARAIPFTSIKSNPNCILVTTPSGGHLGWVAGENAPFGAPWSDFASMQWIQSVLQEMKHRDETD